MKQWNIEINQEMHELFSRLFSSLGLEMPQNVNTLAMEEVLARLNVIIKASKASNTPTFSLVGNSMKLNHASDPFSRLTQGLTSLKTLENEDNTNMLPKNALIISKTGIIRFQLKSLLSKFKINVFVEENQYRGLAEYVKKLFDIVIIDYLDDIKEIQDIVEEIKRISDSSSADTRIIILLAPEELSLKDKITSHNVNVIIKNENWYELLLKELSLSKNQLILT